MATTWVAVSAADIAATAHERRQEREAAIAAYRQAIAIVPTHGPARRALARLGAAGEDELASMAAANPCRINFGGKVILLGYAISQEPAPATGGDGAGEEARWGITYVWQFQERMFDGYMPAVQFADEAHNPLFQDTHRILLNGERYLVDFPRCGEVVAERRLLPRENDPRQAVFMRVSIRATDPPPDVPSLLSVDADERGLFNTLIERPPVPAEATVSTPARGSE